MQNKLQQVFITICTFGLLIGCQSSTNSTAKDLPPPNILWITVEDISPQLGCYGDEFADTPNLDRLAKEGILYQNAFASAPVCAVARSGIISGIYASSLGTQHMRCKGQKPEEMQLYPELLRQAGYYCTNNVKTDYNLVDDPKSIWDDCSNTAHWRSRPQADQPFFAIMNFISTHESRVNRLDLHQKAVQDLPKDRLKKAGDVPLPPYFPQTPTVDTLWTRYYNNITAMDQQVGNLLTQLEEDGLSDNTIIFFYSDHGAGVPRYKRWLYDTGLKVPLIVKAPKKYEHLLPYSPKTKTKELVSFIDLAPTALQLAGVEIPEYYQGRAFLGSNLPAQRKYVFAGRDRMDERYDVQRSVRDTNFLYVRYYEDYQPFCQYMNTPEKGAIMQAIRRAADEGNLPRAGQHIVAATKPNEELFDTRNDPYQLNNLADDPQFATKLKELRQAHTKWSNRIKDTGLIPETIMRSWEKQYDQSIYNIVRSESFSMNTVLETALGEESVAVLQQKLSNANPAVRYWAAIHMGNQINTVKDFTPLQKALADTIPAVRFAAGRALCKADKCTDALSVVAKGLTNADEWVRLNAAQVLDGMDKQSRAVLPDLQKALRDDNKYVVRVANRAVNQLMGTEHVVK
ncbi:MAG: sulfatase-like hydrolase/transferase [Bacteroidota bacterium]